MPTKQPMPPVPPLQPLLFWETGVLLFVAGIVTARFPVPALTACALFAWVDSRTRRPLCCLLAAACVIAGWWIGEKSVPRVPQEYPAWLEKSLSSRRAVTVEGVIVGSRGLPDQRLQIILDDVGPAEKEPLPGRMALTWQDMPDVPRPLPGQRITADLKIRPVHGFHNQGTWNSEDYWHRQGVFFQAWAKQDDATIRTSGTPSAGAPAPACRRRAGSAGRKRPPHAFPFQYGQKRFPAGGPAVPKRLERTAFTPTAGEPPVRS